MPPPGQLHGPSVMSGAVAQASRGAATYFSTPPGSLHFGLGARDGLRWQGKSGVSPGQRNRRTCQRNRRTCQRTRRTSAQPKPASSARDRPVRPRPIVTRVRQVVGKVTRELDADAFAQVREEYSELVVDLGTGDGKHVLAVARTRPDALVVGVDASPAAMRETAAAAARKPAKGGVPNALFVWAAVEKLPPELSGVTELHVLMPWGSLLRALVEPDAAVLRAVAGRCVPDAPFLVTYNLHAWRPPVPEVGDTDEPSPDTDFTAWQAAGWSVEAATYPSAAELSALGTSWTKRLRASRDELAALAIRGRLER